jgi:hypothetical protein
MNTIQSTFSSPRFNRILFWIGVAVLAAGVVVIMIKFVGGSDKTSVSPDKGFKPTLPGKEQPLQTADGTPVTKYSQLTPEVKTAIDKFVLGAVAGKDYAGSFKYTTSSLRQGYTYKQWVRSDERPYQPFPVGKINILGIPPGGATTKEIYVDMRLYATPKAGIKPARFRIGLVPAGKDRWLVEYWGPLYGPLVPIYQ